jgi:hypothetical protein
MPLMCCDTCSELDFKPLGLGAVYVAVCAFCKKLSSHSAVAQYAHSNLKHAKPDELVVKDSYIWIHAGGAIEGANLGLSFQLSSLLPTVRSRGILQ